MPILELIFGGAVLLTGLGIIHKGDRSEEESSSSSSSSEGYDGNGHGYDNDSWSTDKLADWDGTYSD